MDWRRRIAAGLAGLGLGLAAAPGRAHDHEIKLNHQPTPRSNVATPHTEARAGYPHEISPLAIPPYNEHYSGSYVGGGRAFGGHGRCANEGTFGWDYTPFRPLSPRIFLGWSHGRNYQGGTQGYATEGPKPLERAKEAVHGHFGRE